MNTRLWISAPCVLVAALGACTDQPDDAVDSTEQAVCASPDPFDCEPTTAPLDAPEVTATARTTSSLTVQFQSASWYTSAVLQRRPVTSTTWTTLATFAGGYSGTRTWTDSARAADSVYCYRTRVSDGTQAAYSSERCALTSAPSSTTINRLQLRLVLADVADAGTGDNVGVHLSEMSLPGSNFTGLDYAPIMVPTATSPYYAWIDDFTRGRDFTYDLDPKSIARLHDISEIKLNKYGTDGMCVARFQLLVNNRVAYDRNFGTSTCQWIDGNDGHQPTFTVTHAELRAATSFTGFSNPVPTLFVCPGGGWCTTIPRQELEARIEGMVGNKIWNSSDLYWSAGEIYGGRAVEVSRVDTDTFHVDLDLAGNVPYAPDPEVDVDFDINAYFVATPAGYDLRLDVANLHVATDFAWWAEAIGLLFTPFCGSGATEIGCAGAVEDTISAAVEAGFDVQSQRIPMSTAGFCTAPPFTLVNSDGSLTIGCL